MALCDETRISEKRYYTIAPQPLTVDGTSNGVIEVASTFCWKVGMCVTVVSNTVAPRKVKIKAVLSETEIMIGDVNTPIYKGQDVSDLLVADSAMIGLPEDHENNKRPVIHLNEIYRQVYEEEPTVAIRSHLVDWLGRSYCKDNPLPVDATVSVGDVNVQLTHKDNDPNVGDTHDSIRIGDGVETVGVNPDGSINTKSVDPDIVPTHFESFIATAGTPDSLSLTNPIQLAFVFNPNKGDNKNNSQDVLYITLDGSSNRTTVPRGSSRYFPGVFNTLEVDTNNDGTKYEIILWEIP